MKPALKFALTKMAVLCLGLLALNSCKKDGPVTSPQKPILKVGLAKYDWGEFNPNKQMQTDSIFYDNSGRISAISSTSDNHTPYHLNFTYQNASLFTLNSPVQDKYELDNMGRVVYHSTTEVQQGNTIDNVNRYSYSADGYLKKVTLSIIFNGTEAAPYSAINYEVANGNYTKFTLSNTADNKVTRQYTFTYSKDKVENPSGLLAVTLSGNNFLSIDKYLNYGKPSANRLTAVDYMTANLNGTTSAGSLTAITQLNGSKQLSGLALTGNTLAGLPSDLLSPLPRSVQFTYVK